MRTCRRSGDQKKAGSRIRTDDRLITNQVLYQLSYTGVTGKENLCEDMLSRCTVLQVEVSGENTAHFLQRGTIEVDFFAVGSADDG